MITNLPLFKHKLVVFLGNGAKLVLVKGTGRYFISGALSDYSTSLYELNSMVRDFARTRGGIDRCWEP